ncbi:MAG: LysM peptidoglycan-binding domain-containing protein [Bacteroidia bacterium]|jgi:LysM repeat protein|nr:LysM peptidoglycan-binding domain-containing protein [Bacteroidia bacterium]
MRKHLIYLLLCIIPYLGLAQTDTAVGFSVKFTVEQYIEKYSAIAVDEMYRSKIPASITLAQGILESGNGNSRLAREANNHFGIKCKSTWTGKTLYEDDDAPQECFRKYDAAIDSYRDHSDFLMRNVRYAFLFDLDRTDYKSWAKGLKKAGYATNPQYAELLITFIEKHNLDRFDWVKLSEEEARELKEGKAETIRSYGIEFENNGVSATIAKPNESYAQIALDYELRVYQLYRYNDLEKDAVYKAGDTVYLRPKKAKTDSIYYQIKGRETMHWISQRYAIKLDKLLERNLLEAGMEPATGEIIFLKNKRDKRPLLRDTMVEKAPQIKETIREEPISKNTDSVYNQKIYENPIQNLETQEPVEVVGLDSMHDFKENTSFFHTVQAGETLYGIGKKYGVRVDAIQYLNLLQGDSIGVGQRLIINPVIKSADTKEPQSSQGVHKVKQGETLYSIAKQYGLKPADIIATNSLNGNKVYIGQKLIIVLKRRK